MTMRIKGYWKKALQDLFSIVAIDIFIYICNRLNIMILLLILIKLSGDMQSIKELIIGLQRLMNSLLIVMKQVEMVGFQ